MTKHPVALAIALAFATSVALSGCGRTSNLTEQEHIQRAKDFEDKGDLKASIVELKNAIQINPDSPQARLLLGQIYLTVGMGAEAEKELTRAKALGVNRETINPYLGEALLQTGEYKRVLEEIQPGDQTSKPSLARILQLRADAMIKLGQLQDACNLYQQSLINDTNNPATYWGLAQCAVAERDITKAKQWLDRALRIKNRQAKSWILVGDLKLLEMDFEGALTAYNSALKHDPDNFEALQNRADINIRLGRKEPAKLDIEKIRKLYPKSLAANYLQALFNAKEEKYADAREALQEALKIAPDYLPALMLGGSIEYALGNLQTAESHLNKVIRAAPHNSVALRMLAATQLRLGRPDDAAKTLASIDFEKTKDAGIHAIAGEIALAKKDFAKAADHFERAALIKPENASIRLELGVTRLAQGDQRAMADLQAAADMQDSSSRADTVIILTLLKQEKFDAALASIATLEKKQGASPLSWNYRGIAQLGKKDVASARESFSQALKLDAKFFPAAVNLARLDIRDKNPEAARKRFEAILDKDKNNFQAMMALADLAALEEKESDYVSWLNKAAKADSKAIKPRALLARHYLAKKENQKAVALANEAVNNNPDSLEALNLLGAAQMATGDKAASITTFSRMVQKAPQSPEALLGLALAQIADKQSGKARANLQHAVKLNPDDIRAYDALIGLELAEGKPDTALKIARQIQAQQPKLPNGFDREAQILVAQKQYAQAITAYEQALARGSGAETLINLHRTLITTGDTKTADQRLSSWIKQNPKDTPVRGYAAEYYMASNRNHEAIAQYEEVLKLAPQSVLALNNLAALYQREKDPRALPTAEMALKLAPDQPNVQDTLGWILLERGQVKRSLDLHRKAVSKSPKSANLRYHLAVALARNGNKAEAKKELGQAISAGLKRPELDEAKSLLKSL